MTIPLTVNALLEVLLLVTIASVVAIFAMALWDVRHAYRRREQLRCPVRLRQVKVLFRVSPDGKPTDVIRCSVFGRRPITCGKACLHAGAPV